MADSIERLYDAVLEAKGSDPRVSRTARLLSAGRAKIARKVAEEAVEVVIDAMNSDREAVVRESADLLYNLVVLWAASRVHPSEVWNEMNRRERLLGIAEKLPKRDMPANAGAKPSESKVAALPVRRARHRN